MKHKRNKPLFIHFLSSEFAQKLITPSFFLSDAPHNGRTGYVGPNRLHDNVNSYVRQPDFIVASPAAWLVSQHEPHDGTSPRWSIGEPLVRYKQLYVDILQSLHSTKYLHANPPPFHSSTKLQLLSPPPPPLLLIPGHHGHPGSHHPAMAAAVAAAGLHPDTDTDPRELEAFAERFKQRRIKLGKDLSRYTRRQKLNPARQVAILRQPNHRWNLRRGLILAHFPKIDLFCPFSLLPNEGVTQADVGKALANLKLPGVGALSQSTICRFESLTLSHNNMIALKPILQAWLEEAEAQAKNKRRDPDAPSVLPAGEKKR